MRNRLNGNQARSLRAASVVLVACIDAFAEMTKGEYDSWYQFAVREAVKKEHRLDLVWMPP